MIQTVLTETGSIYVFDRTAMTLLRLKGNKSVELRRDEDNITVVDFEEPEVGKAWILTLDIRQDGILTVRTTSAVVKINDRTNWVKGGTFSE